MLLWEQINQIIRFTPNLAPRWSNLFYWSSMFKWVKIQNFACLTWLFICTFYSFMAKNNFWGSKFVQPKKTCGYMIRCNLAFVLLLFIIIIFRCFQRRRDLVLQLQHYITFGNCFQHGVQSKIFREFNLKISTLNANDIKPFVL